MSQNNPKIAIVHDWLYGGGAEKVVEQLHILYPDAPIYTSYCSDEWRSKLDNQVITGYLQKWPFSKLRKFLPLLRQWWFASIDLSDFDIVLVTTGNGEAKFVRPKSEATFICYCHTPPHFYWRKYHEYLKNPGFGNFDWLARIGLKLLVKPLRNRDYKAAQRPNYFIGNSTHISRDIKKYYGRDATTIFPPVNIEKFAKAHAKPAPNKPFIYWGRHVPDKRIDLAIEACNALGKELVIAGEGVDTNRLKKIAGPTITFVGKVSDDELVKLASQAQAFIFTSYEDFGIAPVEAMAAGLPVIAYKAGGALDYVIEGQTGMFYNEQTAAALKETLERFDPQVYSAAKLTNTAASFSNKAFIDSISNYLAKNTI